MRFRTCVPYFSRPPGGRPDPEPRRLGRRPGPPPGAGGLPQRRADPRGVGLRGGASAGGGRPAAAYPGGPGPGGADRAGVSGRRDCGRQPARGGAPARHREGTGGCGVPLGRELWTEGPGAGCPAGGAAARDQQGRPPRGRRRRALDAIDCNPAEGNLGNVRVPFVLYSTGAEHSQNSGSAGGGTRTGRSGGRRSPGSQRDAQPAPASSAPEGVAQRARGAPGHH